MNADVGTDIRATTPEHPPVEPHARERITAELNARNAENAISVALFACEAAGWSDLASMLLHARLDALKRRRRVSQE